MIFVHKAVSRQFLCKQVCINFPKDKWTQLTTLVKLFYSSNCCFLQSGSELEQIIPTCQQNNISNSKKGILWNLLFYGMSIFSMTKARSLRFQTTQLLFLPDPQTQRVRVWSPQAPQYASQHYHQSRFAVRNGQKSPNQQRTSRASE